MLFRSMLDSIMYEVCISPETGGIVAPVDSCQMCKKLIINAGILRIFYRDTATEYHSTEVSDWIINDDSLGKIGY